MDAKFLVVGLKAASSPGSGQRLMFVGASSGAPALVPLEPFYDPPTQRPNGSFTRDYGLTAIDLDRVWVPEGSGKEGVVLPPAADEIGRYTLHKFGSVIHACHVLERVSGPVVDASASVRFLAALLGRYGQDIEPAVAAVLRCHHGAGLDLARLSTDQLAGMLQYHLRFTKHSDATVEQRCRRTGTASIQEWRTPDGRLKLTGCLPPKLEAN